MFASANGQTGRTLSDKDLAYHLEIVGSGASNDSEVLKTNLLRAVDSLISGNDNDIQIRLNKGDMRQYNPKIDGEMGNTLLDLLIFITTLQLLLTENKNGTIM